MSAPMMGLVHALGLSLLHSLWQGALIAVLAAVALRALRSASAQLRYAVACAALLMCLVLPLLSFIVLVSTAAPAVSNKALQVAASTLAGTSAMQIPAFSSAPMLGATTWISMLWTLGVSYMALRLGLGLAWVRTLRCSPQLSTSTDWQSRVDHLAQRVGLRGRVQLLIAPNLSSPISVGWLHPVVVLPAALLTRMPVDLLEALIAHELAHIRRHDYLVNLLQHGIEALLFFHPVVWWLSQRIRLERELIADQLALAAPVPPQRLALALSELSDYVDDHAVPPAAMAATGGCLLPRIRHLLTPKQRMRGVSWIAVPLFALAAAGLTSCVYSYAHFSQRESAAHHVLDHVPATTVANPGERATRLSFALVRGAGQPIVGWGPDDDIHLAAAARVEAGIAGEFLLIRRNGVDRVLTDPVLLGPVAQSWRDAERQGLELDALYTQSQNEQLRSAELSARLQSMTPNLDSAEQQAGASALSAQIRSANQRLRTLSAAVDRQERAHEAAFTAFERRLHDVNAQALATDRS